MLASHWLKKVPWRQGLCAVVMLMPLLPGVAAAAPLDFAEGFGLDARSLLLLCILSGSILFFAISGALFLGAARRARRAERRAREKSADLDQARVSFDALLAAEPQVLVHWDPGGQAELVASKVDGDSGLPGDIDGLLRFSDWLEASSAKELKGLIDALLEAGEGFKQRIQTSKGCQLEAIGRASAGGATLRLQKIPDDPEEAGACVRSRAGVESELNAARSLLDAMPMPAWFRDASGKLTWVNKAYAQSVDRETSDEVCENQVEFLSTRQRDKAAKSLEKGEAHSARIHAVVSGERRAYDAIVQPVDGASAGIAIDVAALETAQSALSKNIEEHTQTLDRITTAVAIFTPDKRLQYYNQAFLDLWKLEEDWLGKSPTDGEILDMLRQRRCLPEQADYRAWKQKHLDRYETTGTHEDRWHLPDGRTVHLVAFHAAGGSATYLFENITEELALKSSYNALIRVQKETLDHLREGVAVFATDGRLKLFNPSFANIWKLDPEALAQEPHIDEVTGWCRTLLDDEQAWAEVKHAITSIDDERSQIEGQLRRPDGRVLAYAGLPLPDGATLLTYIDITDSKRVENALIERNEALVAADRLKSAFISHVSYELRTPLTNIIGFAELLNSPSTGALNERQKEYLGDIRSSSDSLLTIINDILDLATIDAGALELSLAPVKAEEVIKAAVIGVRERIKQAGLDLRVRVSEDAREFVADGQRLTQVLFNLLSNAVGFSESGGAISINCRREDDMIAISVEDKGRGIPEDYQQSAFDRFESRPQGSQHRGAGLGLSIVRNLVELHGGSVKLASTPGVGTTVTVLIPVRDAGAGSSETETGATTDTVAPSSAATG